MLNQIKIIDNELISTLIIEKKDFIKSSNLIENKNCLILNSLNEEKINKFIKNSDWEIYIWIDYQNKDFDKEEIEKYMNFEIKKEEVYRVIFVKHEDVNKNFDFLMNETLVLMIDKKINLNNL